MTIATLNIDWAGVYRSGSHRHTISQLLEKCDFDILVLTEAVPLVLPQYSFVFQSEILPKDTVYQGINYSQYLRQIDGHSVIVYSKFQCVKQHTVADPKTSVAVVLATPAGNIILYATIIGTQFRKKPYAAIELENCIHDCQYLATQQLPLFIAGDLNTSFLANEKNYSINQNTTAQLTKMVQNLKLEIATKNIPENIDHIILPKAIQPQQYNAAIFIEKGAVSDHHGVVVHF